MIHLLTIEHVEYMDRLATDAYGIQPWTLEQYRSAFNQNFHHAYGYFIDGKCVAFIQVNILYDEGEILNIATHPDYQGQGIAKSLIEFVISQASRWILEVRASNTRAQLLYTTCGFEKIAERKKYYHHPVEDAWIMERKEKL